MNAPARFVSAEVIALRDHDRSVGPFHPKMPQPKQEMYDPRSGGEALGVERLRASRRPSEPARTNCFTVYFIESGSGTFWVDTARFAFAPNSLLFFTPYQHIRFEPDTAWQAQIVRFHANFLCVETFHAEVGCSGVLFNDPYGIPVVALDERAASEAAALFDRIQTEYEERGLAFEEVMLAQLKVLLILATRLKSARAEACGSGIELRHPVLAELRDLIETNYRRWHAPAEYAEQLHVTAKTLGRIVREHLGTTPTDLIRNRILIHAKWHLLHTLKPVKELAHELGFADELYFSRLFKRSTGRSPTSFREFETEIRGGSNLSMTSSHAPILRSVVESDS